MVEIVLVRRDKGLGGATVQTRLEEDIGVGARAQIGRRPFGERGTGVADVALLLEVVGGVALRVLRVAVRDGGVDCAAVGGVGAGVVLHVAGAAEGGLFADKGVAVDGEGSVTG